MWIMDLVHQAMISEMPLMPHMDECSDEEELAGLYGEIDDADEVGPISNSATRIVPP